MKVHSKKKFRGRWCCYKYCCCCFKASIAKSKVFSHVKIYTHICSFNNSSLTEIWTEQRHHSSEQRQAALLGKLRKNHRYQEAASAVCSETPSWNPDLDVNRVCHQGRGLYYWHKKKRQPRSKVFLQKRHRGISAQQPVSQHNVKRSGSLSTLRM